MTKEKFLSLTSLHAAGSDILTAYIESVRAMTDAQFAAHLSRLRLARQAPSSRLLEREMRRVL